jgi:hypothetical protein
LLSTDFDNSTRLASCILKAHEDILKVPTLKRENDLSYIPKVCVETEYEGVYARNLALLRIVRGPIAYIESLIQDNKEEILLLSKNDYKSEGIVTSERLHKVIQSYVLGVNDFLAENKLIKEKLARPNQ